MIRRFTATFTVATLLLVPLAASADDASTLGPNSTTSSPGGSSADASALQPAGVTIQSPPGSSSSLTSPTGSAGDLQQPATTNNNQLQVMLGGGSDGAPHNTGSSHSALWYAFWIVVALVIAGAAHVYYRRLRRSKATVAANIANGSGPISLDENGSSEVDGDGVTSVIEHTAHGQKRDSNSEHVSSTTTQDEPMPTDPKFEPNGESDKEATQIVSKTDKKTGDTSG
jgi:hypothetical protein